MEKNVFVNAWEQDRILNALHLQQISTKNRFDIFNKSIFLANWGFGDKQQIQIAIKQWKSGFGEEITSSKFTFSTYKAKLGFFRQITSFIFYFITCQAKIGIFWTNDKFKIVKNALARQNRVFWSKLQVLIICKREIKSLQQVRNTCTYVMGI